MEQKVGNESDKPVENDCVFAVSSFGGQIFASLVREGRRFCVVFLVVSI